MSTYDMLRAHYATRSDDELKTLGSTPDLPEEAARALNDEIASRGMDPALRRQAAIVAAFAAMEQEKQESLQRSRRALQTGLAVASICGVVLVCYALLAAMPAVAGHGKLLFFVMVVPVFVIAGVAIHRSRRARQEQSRSQEPPAH